MWVDSCNLHNSTPTTCRDISINHTHLCPIDEDDPIRMEGNTREKLKELLKSVPIGWGEEEAEQPQGIPTLCRTPQP